MRIDEHYEITQSKFDGDITIRKDGKMIFHAMHDAPKNEEELRECFYSSMRLIELLMEEGKNERTKSEKKEG